jgi:penicillin-binding protein 1C
VIGVWVGRADAAPVPGISGYTTAAPILFEAFQRSGVATVPLPRAPAGAVRLARDELPVTLRRFTSQREAPGARVAVEPPPEIVFPPDGARVELAAGAAVQAPLVLKLQGGRAPFRWLANGRRWREPARGRTSQWQPDGLGHSTLTVIDAAGRAAACGCMSSSGSRGRKYR